MLRGGCEIECFVIPCPPFMGRQGIQVGDGCEDGIVRHFPEKGCHSDVVSFQ